MVSYDEGVLGDLTQVSVVFDLDVGRDLFKIPLFCLFVDCFPIYLGIALDRLDSELPWSL